jgi:hypothetical protein
MNLATGLALVAAIVLVSSKAASNEIYINQVGSNLDLDITQDGDNNKIGAYGNIANKGTMYTNGGTISYSQTGNNNTLQFWSYDIGSTTQTLTQTGDNNDAVIDCHGERCDITVTQDGDGNDAHAELGNQNGHNDNVIVIYQKGDTNDSYVEADGDSNDLDSHQQSDNNFSRVVVTGNYNMINAWQGKHADNTVDVDETGDHEVYWTVTGDNNVLDSYQTDTNRGGGGGAGHHIANVITGDNNGVTHTQKGKAGHDGFIEIDGDNNDVELYQRGNGGQQWADIVLTGDGHTVDANQRGTMAHSFEVDLTNSGGAYSVTSNQTTNNTTTSKSYSLTGICTNTAGCSVSVSQN